MTSVEERGIGLTVVLRENFDNVQKKVREAFKEEGFGVLTEVDVRATLKEKIGVDFPKYLLLGACNPQIAHKALQSNPEVGLMLPCSVLVYESGDNVIVSALNPDKALGALNAPELEPFAREASSRIRAAMANVAGFVG